MIKNGMWDFFSLPDPRNKDKNWDILIHQYILPLDYVKRHVQSLQKGSEENQYGVKKPDMVTNVSEEHFVV